MHFIFFEKNEIVCQVPLLYCCSTAPTAESEASLDRWGHRVGRRGGLHLPGLLL